VGGGNPLNCRGSHYKEIERRICGRRWGEGTFSRSLIGEPGEDRGDGVCSWVEKGEDKHRQLSFEPVAIIINKKRRE